MNASAERALKERTSWGHRIIQYLATGGIAVLALSMINCGGGSGGSSSGTKNPTPTLASISPSTAPAGSPALTLTVTGSGFVSGSVVQWNGSSRSTVYVSSSSLKATITVADLSNAGSASVTVFNPSPGGGASAASTFTIAAVAALSIQTKALPNATNSKSYSYTLQATGGISPYSWKIAAGSLPSGLSLSTDGVISGTPPAVASDTKVEFYVQASDSSAGPTTVNQALSILVHSGSLGRNDSCPSGASAISNGTIRASLSPYGDVDVYSFQGTAGSSLTAEIYAQRLTIYDGSTTQDVFIDSFLELLNSSCTRLTYNDDITLGVIQDSRISGYTLPYTGTYYLRVSDLRGDGRPDFIYELHLSGAN